MAYKWTVSTTIPATADGLSAVQDFGGGATRMGLIMPADWTAASISFQVSTTAGGTFYDLYNEAGTEVSIAVTDDKTYSLNTSVAYLSPFRWVKVRSGVTALAVQQGAPRVLTFVFQR